MAAALLRGQLRSYPANGHGIFLPQIRKLVFEYCDKWPSSANTRTYILNHLESLARANPHVEVVVRQRNYKEPIVRGYYGMLSSFSEIPSVIILAVNNRDKVIPLNGFEVTGIEKKVELLLDSSGAKIRALKKPVESSTEATRGIWSGLHAERPRL